MGKIFGIFLIAFLGFCVYSYTTLPSVLKMNSCFTTSMNKVYLCPSSKNYVRLSQISPNIKNAILISEDVGFYSHDGFEIEELKNSFWTNLERMSFARGGSTITQQLAKNLYLSGDKTLTRKIKEIILTKRIEEKYSKNIILEKYLNVVEFGKNIYGIKKATEFYFQKPPSMISPLEAAFIAFLLPNPVKYSVSFKKKELTPFARKRLKDILYKMFYYKKILEPEYAMAKEQLESMFRSIPEMEGEPTEDEFLETPLYSADKLQDEQMQAIENLEMEKTESPKTETEIEQVEINDLDAPSETIYPDEIPQSEVYNVEQ